MELCRGIYLAGPMEGFSGAEMKGWRTTAKIFFDNSGIKVLDPTRRVSYHEQCLEDRGLDLNIAKRIFKQDLRDIARCEVLLVDMRDHPNAKAQGTAAEIMFAHMKHKVIIIWKKKTDNLNPFVAAMATEIHNTITEAMEACVEYAG